MRRGMILEYKFSGDITLMWGHFCRFRKMNDVGLGILNRADCFFFRRRGVEI